MGMNGGKYAIEQIVDAIVQADEEIAVVIAHKDREISSIFDNPELRGGLV